MKMSRSRALAFVVITLAAIPLSVDGQSVGTAFTFQGRLTDGGSPATGQYDFQFGLYSTSAGFFPVATPVTVEDKQVTNGLFTVNLDFGSGVFTGNERWLKIGVRPHDSTGAYVYLSPLQELTPAPYALYALDAPSSGGLTLPYSATYTDPGATGAPAFEITANGDAIRAIEASASGTPEPGEHNEGGRFTASGDDAIGVYASGEYGVHGETSVVGGAGVYGQGSATAATGVRGESSNGTGVSGSCTATSGSSCWGVYGWCNNPDGRGVQGQNLAATGAAVAVHGDVASGNPDAFGGWFEGRGYFEGNLGIGVTDPTAKLDVNGTAKMTGFQLGTSATAGYVLTTDANGVGTWQAGGGGGASVWATSGSDIYYNSGNVGIGITTPRSSLDTIGGISTGSNAADSPGTVTFFAPDGFAWFHIDNGPAGGRPSGRLRISQGGNPGDIELMSILQNGQVGIGTSTPSAKLDVTGTVEMAGFKLTTSPTAGHVLVSDAAGVGTWQPAPDTGMILPHEETVTTSSAVLSVTNDNGDGATGMLAQETIGVEGRTSNYEGAGVVGANDHYGTGGSLGQGKYGVWATTTRTDGAAGYFNGGGNGASALVAVGGMTKVDTIQINGGSDLSEQFDIESAGAHPEPGMVVCIDPANPGKLIVSSKPYDRTVAGVISGAGGIQPGMTMGQQGTVACGAHPVALTGRVHVHADVASGAIQPGDLLTTSDKPGHAMKVADYMKAQGAILGKAMTSLDEGSGLVLVLVTLQ